jgi:tRNA(fMet)-specific endonuclease VapC
LIRYLLDTDICSYVAKRNRLAVLERFAQLHPGDWAVSAITFAEMLFGIESLPSDHRTNLNVRVFLFDADVLDWPSSAATSYAAIRHRTRPQPLQDRDIFIAAHAIAIDAILVTNNTRHFSRMGGCLRYENWLEASPGTGS